MYIWYICVSKVYISKVYIHIKIYLYILHKYAFAHHLQLTEEYYDSSELERPTGVLSPEDCNLFALHFTDLPETIEG